MSNRSPEQKLADAKDVRTTLQSRLWTLESHLETCKHDLVILRVSLDELDERIATLEEGK